MPNISTLFPTDNTTTERGTHAELMALGGEYKHLYDLQTRLTEQ